MLDVLPLLGVWLLAVVIPGPDFVMVVQTASSKSRRHGLMAAAGVSSAMLLWATGSMLGLSVLLARLSWLYDVVRLAGAAYLVYLGARMLWSSRRSRSRGEDQPVVVERDPRPGGLWRSYRIGFLTNAANPKAAAFFGSLLGAMMPPQPDAGLRFFTIAAIVAIALIWYVVVAGLFGSGPVATVYRRLRRWIDRVAATALILLGGRLAVER